MKTSARPLAHFAPHPALAQAVAEQVSFGVAMDLSLARAAGDQGKTPPPWIPLYPAPDADHKITARDGRSWTMRDPQVVVAHFAAYGADVPLDIEHATELLAPKGKPAPAQAWIKEVQVRPDRSIWGRAEWTPAGLASYASGGWRYISPAILHNDAGEVTGLSSAGMVTRPALHMPALARNDRETLQRKDLPMTQITLATLIGVAGLASTVSEADALAAIRANAQAARDLADPTKFVPAADLAAMATRATTAETALTTRAASDKEAVALASVESAVTAGKIPPASKDHWLSIARDNPEAFDKAMAAMPQIAGLAAAAQKKDPVDGGDADGLTADQLALCASVGIEPKAFAAALKEKN